MGDKIVYHVWNREHVHEVEGLTCWCNPELARACPACENNPLTRLICPLCGGIGAVVCMEGANPDLVIHRYGSDLQLN